MICFKVGFSGMIPPYGWHIFVLLPGPCGDRTMSRELTGSAGTSVSTRSSVSTTCSDSGEDDSAGITTTGLMCSDRADARRKFGGFCKNQGGTRLIAEPPQNLPNLGAHFGLDSSLLLHLT